MSHPSQVAGFGTTGGKSFIVYIPPFFFLRLDLELTFSRCSNGDPGWTGAPPLQDNVMEISKIEMYYNRTSSAGSC